MPKNEIGRLLAVDSAERVKTRLEAQEWLGVSGDAAKEDVKRVWRRLLRFLNSDFGRGTEQAIHRKKDEIAKRLQEARDILSRQ